jgi:hypothetical protein
MMAHLGDFALPECDSLKTYFNVLGWPDCVFNYHNGSASSYDYYLAWNSKFGVAISSSINGTTANVKVLTGFTQTFTQQLKLVVYLTEDSISFPQANYYNTTTSSPLYGLGDPIVNFNHDFVFRKVISSSCFGDVIPASSTTAGGKFLKNYSFTIPSSSIVKHLNIVAFVTDGSFFIPSSTYFVFNVNGAKLGQTNLWY